MNGEDSIHCTTCGGEIPRPGHEGVTGPPGDYIICEKCFKALTFPLEGAGILGPSTREGWLAAYSLNAMGCTYGINTSIPRMDDGLLFGVAGPDGHTVTYGADLDDVLLRARAAFEMYDRRH